MGEAGPAWGRADRKRREEGRVRRSPEERRRRRQGLAPAGPEEAASCEGSSEASEGEEDGPGAGAVSRAVLARTRRCLAQEQLESSSGRQLACLTCLRRFANLQNLRRHLRLHLKRDSHLAEIDSEGEEEEPGKGRPLDCDFCPEKFVNKAAFAVHCLTHRAQELACYVCRKSYSDRYSLRYHLRTHGIGRQIRCELCGKNFTKQSRLTAHIDSIHNDVRRFPCPHCDKAFKARLHLENHLVQHTGERPFTCPTCGDTFRHKVSMVTHQRGHTNSRPYVCQDCGKAFRGSSSLRAHQRVHSGERPYCCAHCDKTFTQRAGLNYHMHVHSGEKPHACGLCPYRTAKRASLRCHLKAMHRDEEGVAPQEEPAPAPAPPSPPGQQGDCLPCSTLPSFSLLKRYEEPEVAADREDRDTPSLSPPLTPAPEEPYPFSYPTFPPYPAPPYPGHLSYEERKGQYPAYEAYYYGYYPGEEEGGRPRKDPYPAYH